MPITEKPREINESSNESSQESALETAHQPQQEFKEGGFGWVVIAAVFFLNAHTWGLNSTFAVFLAYYLKTNTFQATPIGYAFVGGLSISIALLASPLVTTLVGWKRFGTRWTIFTGVIFQTIGFIGSSFAVQLWQLVLSQGISFGFGMGFCFVASVAVPPQWFTKHRSLANSLAAGGSGFGGLVYNIATNALIARIGLPWTFRVIAIICFVVNGVASYFIRDRNKELRSVTMAFNWRLFKRPSFLLFQAWAVLLVFGYTIINFSIVDYCQVIGLSASQASLVGALFSLSQAIGRPIIGLSSDYFGRLNVASFVTLFCGVLCLFVWIFAARNLAICIVFALLCGGPAGVLWAVIAPVCAEVVGLTLIPSALSITWLVLVLPATFAEVIGLSLRESGSWGYLRPQLFTAFMYIGGFLFIWCLRVWKVWELERTRQEKEQQGLAATQDDANTNENGSSSHAGLQRNVSPTSAVRQRISMLERLYAVEHV